MAAMPGRMITRTRPNILVTGTPGTGKTITCNEVADKTGYKHVDVGQVAKVNRYYEGWDEQYQCPILDEDKVLDELEDQMSEGGNLLEYHSCELFPERWIDAVFVLRTDNGILYDRLEKRGYSGKKLTDNVQCEIFQTIAEEAKQNYSHNIIFELTSNTPEQIEANVDAICMWMEQWKTPR